MHLDLGAPSGCILDWVHLNFQPGSTEACVLVSAFRYFVPTCFWLHCKYIAFSFIHTFAFHPITIYRAQDIMVYIFSIPVQHTARKVDPIPQPLPGQGTAHCSRSTAQPPAAAGLNVLHPLLHVLHLLHPHHYPFSQKRHGCQCSACRSKYIPIPHPEQSNAQSD